MTPPRVCDVLVVGLGPVGATLAALLADAGVEVIAIDKSTEVYPLPRAAHFDDEIMRTFQQLGIADEVQQHARPANGYEFRSADGEVLLSFDGLGAELAPSGWPSGFMFNQPGLERALRAKLERAAHAQLILGVAFDGLSADPDVGLLVQLAGPEVPLQVRARYVVGCDGAWSPVRDVIGSGLDDLQFDEPWLVIDAIPRAGARMPEVNLQICDPARPTTCVLMGPGRHRWEFMLLPGETADQVMDDGFIADLLAKWDVDVEIERKAVYRFHGLVADRWRSGRVLIAGDAAHQMPPFAGQGMCAGIRDAANLAWKLAAVLRGRASEELLGTYQVEREPNVRAYVELAISMGRVVCTLDPEQARLRNSQMLAARRAGVQAVPPASPPALGGPAILAGTPGAGEIFPQPVVDAEGGMLRLDDTLGAGAWLIATALPASLKQDDVAVVSLDGDAAAPFKDRLAGWLSRNGVEAVLVRPDRYVYGSGAPEQLLEAWAATLRPPKLASGAAE